MNLRALTRKYLGWCPGQGSASNFQGSVISEFIRNLEAYSDFRLVLASIMKKNPDFTIAAFQTENQHDQEKTMEAKMFFDEFGEELLENIPDSMRSRKAILEKMMENPTMLGKIIPSLWT